MGQLINNDPVNYRLIASDIEANIAADIELSLHTPEFGGHAWSNLSAAAAVLTAYDATDDVRLSTLTTSPFSYTLDLSAEETVTKVTCKLGNSDNAAKNGGSSLIVRSESASDFIAVSLSKVSTGTTYIISIYSGEILLSSSEAYDTSSADTLLSPKKVTVLITPGQISAYAELSASIIISTSFATTTLASSNNVGFGSHSTGITVNAGSIWSDLFVYTDS